MDRRVSSFLDHARRMLAAGRLDVRIGHRYDLAHARTAHDDLQGRRTTGKVLLVP